MYKQLIYILLLKQKRQRPACDCWAITNRFSHVLPPNTYTTYLQVLLTESSGQWWWHWQDSFFCGGAGAVLSPSSFLVSMLNLPELRKAMLSRKLAVNVRGGRGKETVLDWIARLGMKALKYLYPSKFWESYLSWLLTAEKSVDVSEMVTVFEAYWASVTLDRRC